MPGRMVFLSAILQRLTATQARRHLIRVGVSHRECSAKQPSEAVQTPAGGLFGPRWVIGAVYCWDGLQTAPGTFYEPGRCVPAIDLGRGMSCRPESRPERKVARASRRRQVSLLMILSSARSQVSLASAK